MVSTMSVSRPHHPCDQQPQETTANSLSLDTVSLSSSILPTSPDSADDITITSDCITSASALLECRPRLSTAYCYICLETTVCVRSRPRVQLSRSHEVTWLSVFDEILDDGALVLRLRMRCDVSEVQCVSSWESGDVEEKSGGDGRYEAGLLGECCEQSGGSYTVYLCVRLALSEQWCGDRISASSSSRRDDNCSWSPHVDCSYHLCCSVCYHAAQQTNNNTPQPILANNDRHSNREPLTGNNGNTTGNSGNNGNTSGNNGNTTGNSGNNGNTTGNKDNSTGNSGNNGNTSGNKDNSTGNNGKNANTAGNSDHATDNCGNDGGGVCGAGRCDVIGACASLLTHDGSVVRRCLPLPSDNWRAALSDAVCCCAGEAARQAPLIMSARARARLGDVLTAAGCFVLAQQAVHNVSVLTADSWDDDCETTSSPQHASCHVGAARASAVQTVRCALCRTHLGDVCHFGVRLWRHRVVWQRASCTSTDSPPSILHPPPHPPSSAPPPPSPPLPSPAVTVTADQLLWRLLCDKLAEAPVKMLLRRPSPSPPPSSSTAATAGGHALLLQLLDSQLLPVQLFSSSGRRWSAGGPTVAIKLLYRHVCDSQERDKLTLDFDVEVADMPEDLHDLLAAKLIESTALFPRNQRSVAAFSIGLLIRQ